MASALPDGLASVGGLTIYSFAPSRLGVFGAQAAGDFAPLGPDDVLAASGAVAALDGPEFDLCAGQGLPAGNAAYAVAGCARPAALVYDAARGLAAPGRRSGAGLTVSVVGGRAVVAPGDAAAPGASAAVQLWPPLVSGGQVVASDTGSNAEVNGRAALAVLDDGRLAFAVGRMPMVAFARALAAAGATDAGYTDGGGSTALVVPGAVYGSSERRRVPTWLTVEPAGPGAGVVVGALLAAAGVAAVVVALGRRGR